MSGLRLGCIADDITGATDLANALVGRGVSTQIVFGVPRLSMTIDPGVGAIVVALKTRTAPVDDARRQSIESARWLISVGATQLYVKYCSTFDSTSQGNIGPVTEALADVLGSRIIAHAPSYPSMGRTLYNGNLFVHGVPLNETSMREHPLTPMRDSNLVRVLASQSARPVALIDLDVVRGGEASLRRGLQRLDGDATTHVLVDMTDDSDIATLASALDGVPGVLAAGSAGLGAAIGAQALSSGPASVGLTVPSGPGAALCGSASMTSRGQIAAFARHYPTTLLSPLDLAGDPELAASTARWAIDLLNEDPLRPVLIAADAQPESIAIAQEQLGAAHAAQLLEDALGVIARRLVESGVRRLVVAGGESSGAVVAALGLKQAAIGQPLEPGVPWLFPVGEDYAVAFKSGNFGGEDFFASAFVRTPPPNQEASA